MGLKHSTVLNAEASLTALDQLAKVDFTFRRDLVPKGDSLCTSDFVLMLILRTAAYQEINDTRSL